MFLSSIFLFLIHFYLVSCYRHVYFSNADVCDPKGTTKTVEIGDGAYVLSFNNDSFTNYDKLKEEKKICNIMIKTKKGLGLMVHAEDVYLRSEPRNDSKESCIDYIEFGKEDIIPFITLERSGKLCGDQTGYQYDEPGGKLLIWLKLGPYRPLPNRESLSTARLSLVITPYQKTRPCRTCGFKQCSSKLQWIRQKYFCDGRVNCPMNGGESNDEESRSCLTTAAPPTSTTQRTIFNYESDKTKEESSSWNFSFILIALISVVGLFVIACGIVCTLKKWNLNLLPQSPDNCPDTAYGMLELSRMPNRSQENTYIVHPPCPRPTRPTDFIVGPPHLSPSWTRTRPAQNPSRTPGESQRPQTPIYSPTPAPSSSIRMPKQSPLLSPSENEAPPPSYHEIFPPDYVPDAEVMQGNHNDAN